MQMSVGAQVIRCATGRDVARHRAERISRVHIRVFILSAAKKFLSLKISPESECARSHRHTKDKRLQLKQKARYTKKLASEIKWRQRQPLVNKPASDFQLSSFRVYRAESKRKFGLSGSKLKIVVNKLITAANRRMNGI